MKLIKLEDIEPQEVAKLLKEGKVLVFPTETVYGLIADVENKTAVEKVVRIKGREGIKPISILVSNFEMALKYVDYSERLEKLWRKFTPGPITFVARAKKDFHMPFVVSSTGKVGVRCPDFPPLLEVINRLGKGVTGTSANISGEPPAKKLEELSEKLITAVDMVIYCENPLGGTPSTVVEINESIKILREGPVKKKEIEDALQG